MVAYHVDKLLSSTRTTRCRHGSLPRRQTADRAETWLGQCRKRKGPGSQSCGTPSIISSRIRCVIHLLTYTFILWPYAIQSTRRPPSGALARNRQRLRLHTVFQYVPTRPTLPPYLKRFGKARYMCSQPVKLRYPAGHITNALYGLGEDAGELLIYVNWPQTQWLLQSFMKNLGFLVSVSYRDCPRRRKLPEWRGSMTQTTRSPS